MFERKKEQCLPLLHAEWLVLHYLYVLYSFFKPIYEPISVLVSQYFILFIFIFCIFYFGRIFSANVNTYQENVSDSTGVLFDFWFLRTVLINFSDMKRIFLKIFPSLWCATFQNFDVRRWPTSSFDSHIHILTKHHAHALNHQ